MFIVNENHNIQNYQKIKTNYQKYISLRRNVRSNIKHLKIQTQKNNKLTHSFFLKISFFSLTSDRLERKKKKNKKKLSEEFQLRKSLTKQIGKLHRVPVYRNDSSISLSSSSNSVQLHPGEHALSTLNLSTLNESSLPTAQIFSALNLPRNYPSVSPDIFSCFYQTSAPSSSPPIQTIRSSSSIRNSSPLSTAKSKKKKEKREPRISLSLSFSIYLSLSLSYLFLSFTFAICRSAVHEQPAQRKPSGASDSSNFDETARLVSRSRPKFRIQGSFSLDRPRYRRTINEKTLSHWRTRFAMASECLSNVTYKSV